MRFDHGGVGRGSVRVSEPGATVRAAAEQTVVSWPTGRPRNRAEHVARRRRHGDCSGARWLPTMTHAPPFDSTGSGGGLSRGTASLDSTTGQRPPRLDPELGGRPRGAAAHGFAPGLSEADLLSVVDELTAALEAPAPGVPVSVPAAADARNRPRAAARSGSLNRSAWLYAAEPEDPAIVGFLDGVGKTDTSGVRETLAAAARLSARVQRRHHAHRGAPPDPAARPAQRLGRADRAETSRRPDPASQPDAYPPEPPTDPWARAAM